MFRSIALASSLLLIACGSSEEAETGPNDEGSGSTDPISEPSGADSPNTESPNDNTQNNVPEPEAPQAATSSDTEQPGQLLVASEPDDAVGAGGAAQECARDSFDAQRRGVNLYLLLDASGSMGITIRDGFTRWDAVREALTGFISSPDSTGLQLALSYFPNMVPETTLCEAGSQCADGSTCFKAICNRRQAFTGEVVQCVTDDDCEPIREPLAGIAIPDTCRTLGNCVDNPFLLCIANSDCPVGDCDAGAAQGVCAGTSSCETGDYAAPAVAKRALPEAATDLTQSLMSTEPDPAGSTPTFVALAGAYAEANRWRAEQSDSESVVVLATDGFPEGCLEDDADPSESVDRTYQAIEAAERDGTKTFVIGVVDPSGQAARRAPEILNEMAMLGGTNEAQIVTAANSTTEAFAAALEQIRGDVLPCSYKLPETTGTVNPGLVNVEVTRAGATETWPNVVSASDCGTEQGWYYEGDAATPSGIELCSASCALVGEGSASQLDIVLGCATISRVR